MSYNFLLALLNLNSDSSNSDFDAFTSLRWLKTFIKLSLIWHKITIMELWSMHRTYCSVVIASQTNSLTITSHRVAHHLFANEIMTSFYFQMSSPSSTEAIMTFCWFLH